jgi:predicted 3-demethylubiquinone-9 3-methyltransferase (glyoxalase superfamily)
MQAITPFLWLNSQAEEAARFYTSIFKDAQLVEVKHWGAGSPAPAGSVMSATVRLRGQELILFNGGPHYQLNSAFSLMVSCQTQAEVDELWEKLSAGGEIQRCGWLKDKFGVSWQIVPEALPRMMKDKDPAKAKRVMEAMMQMVKLDVGKLERVYEGAA